MRVDAGVAIFHDAHYLSLRKVNVANDPTVWFPTRILGYKGCGIRSLSDRIKQIRNIMVGGFVGLQGGEFRLLLCKDKVPGACFRGREIKFGVFNQMYKLFSVCKAELPKSDRFSIRYSGGQMTKVQHIFLKILKFHTYFI